MATTMRFYEERMMILINIYIIIFTRNVSSSNKFKIRIGAIFPGLERRKDINHPKQVLSGTYQENLDEILNFQFRPRLSFDFALFSLNQQLSFEDYLLTKNILEYSDGIESVYQITKQVCAQLSLGVAAIVTTTPSDVTKSTCAAKRMVNLNVGNSRVQCRTKDGELEFTLNFNPSIETWNLAVADLIVHYEWNQFAIVYCDGILNIEFLILNLNERLGTVPLLLNFDSKLSETELEAGHLNRIKQKGLKNVLVACNAYEPMLGILKAALRNKVLNNDSHYIIFGMNSLHVLKQNTYIFGHCNITALSIMIDAEKRRAVERNWKVYVRSNFRINPLSQNQIGTIDNSPSHAFAVDVALMYDAISFYDAALRHLRKTRPLGFNHRSLRCENSNTWLFGPELIRFLKNYTSNGLTGTIDFDRWGNRKSIYFDVLTTSYNGLKQIGSWVNRPSGQSSDILSTRLQMFNTATESTTESRHSYRNQTLQVTVIVESPYVYRNVTVNKNGERSVVYTGYCIDLLNYLAEGLDFTYNITEVPDHNYGTLNPVDHSWDGMMGEVLYGHADLAVAPLTINYDRERVVKFTKPYMSLGIGIIYRTPKVGAPSLFGFLNPLSIVIWIFIIVAYVSVSILMFFIARLSPYEWYESDSAVGELKKMQNDFGMLDSLWFGMGTLMQQGSDLAPKAISTRLLAGVWWFFTLILISSYTANLAAFLTVTRMETDISSVEDLAAQTEIKYGTLKDGATASFFQKSMLPTFSKMWQFMNHTPTVFTKSNDEGIERVLKGGYAYLMESSTMEYIISRNCNLTQVGGLLDSRGYGIATKKAKLRDDLSVSILKLHEDGELDRIKHKWWKENAAKCPKEDSSKTKSLTVANLGGAFVFLCCGATVAVIVAIIEFFVYSFLNARSKKKPVRRELKLGLATICSCHSEIEKTSFFDKSLHLGVRDEEDDMSCVCCSCMPVPSSKQCSEIAYVDSAMARNKSSRGHRYCPGFNAMVETVLTDQLPPANHACVSAGAELMTSSVNSSKDPDSGMVSFPTGLSRQACFQDTTLESDLVSSSFSLPGGSPSSLVPRHRNDSKRMSMQSCLDQVPSERQSRGNLRREDSEVRRWNFANSRPFSKYASHFDHQHRRSSHLLPRNSLVSFCKEDENQENTSLRNSFIDLGDFSGLKHTVT